MDSGGAVFSIMSLGFREGAIDLVALLGYGSSFSPVSWSLELMHFIGSCTAVFRNYDFSRCGDTQPSSNAASSTGVEIDGGGNGDDWS